MSAALASSAKKNNRFAKPIEPQTPHFITKCNNRRMSRLGSHIHLIPLYVTTTYAHTHTLYILPEIFLWRGRSVINVIEIGK